MNVTQSIDEIRAQRWRDPSQSWGLVPTMGYLHDGHMSLVQRACDENDQVGVSIFVNPTQFGNETDLTKYPRALERDLNMLRDAGVSLVWTPTPDIAYPAGYQTYVNVEDVTQMLEGAARPGHFRGVATIVSKLFNVFQPNRAYFGQKDAQQVAVLKRMVTDLNFNLEIVVGQTQRAADGLAMSSRNARLSAAGRKQATCLYRALTAATNAFKQGEVKAQTLHAIMHEIINAEPLAEIDYTSIANADTLIEQKFIEKPALFSMAVTVAGIRLIDNMVIA